jgi:hypothetical protein
MHSAVHDPKTLGLAKSRIFFDLVVEEPKNLEAPRQSDAVLRTS